MQVLAEILHKSYLLSDLFIVGTRGESKGYKFLIFTFVADVVYLLSIVVKDHFGGIVEVDACGAV